MARYNRQRSYGHEKALEHIRAAQALSSELGGTDEDVKEYFFSLTDSPLKFILNKYENKYGKQAREYAEKTLPKWKKGEVHMSGLVAERLFNLLPPSMPIESKLNLTESLWRHVGPSSYKTYYIGTDVDLEEVSKRVKDHLEKVVVQYNIPEFMEARFNWLSQGDVDIKQQLLNHFIQQEKLLLSEALRTKLPILMDHLNSKEGKLTTSIKQSLIIGKHEVCIVVDDNVNGITDIAPMKKSESNVTGWIIGIILFALFIWFRNK